MIGLFKYDNTLTKERDLTVGMVWLVVKRDIWITKIWLVKVHSNNAVSDLLVQRQRVPSGHCNLLKNGKVPRAWLDRARHLI